MPKESLALRGVLRDWASSNAAAVGSCTSRGSALLVVTLDGGVPRTTLQPPTTHLETS